MDRPSGDRSKRLVASTIMAGVYGAAVGMVVGFAYQNFVEVAADRAVAVWRNFILAGAVIAVGLKFAVSILADSKRGAGNS